ncbi:MAG: hypothetical protein ACR2QM_12070 [Longimicrobiales bacterium]
MSQFEYVSVASALVYSFAIARLLGGLPHTSTRSSGGAVVFIWNLTLILWALSAWWIFWRFNQLPWSALSFLWAVGTPSLTYLMAAILLTDEPSRVASWQDHFFCIRRRFFGVLLVGGVHTSLMPWVFGAYPWFAPAPAHIAGSFTLAVAALGLSSTSARLHVFIAGLMFLVMALGVFLVPAQLPAA